jgi:hypothetical protein
MESRYISNLCPHWLQNVYFQYMVFKNIQTGIQIGRSQTAVREIHPCGPLNNRYCKKKMKQINNIHMSVKILVA